MKVNIIKDRLLMSFLLLLVLRAVIACVLWPGADEAYYFVYSLHPSLSYFDHPPVVAFIGGGVARLLGIISPIGIRLGPLALFAASVYFFFQLAKRFLPDDEARTAAVVFMWIPMFFFPGTLLLPDSALIPLWLASLFYFHRAVEDSAISDWILTGITAGLGMMSKYTAAYIFIGGFIYIIFAGRTKVFRKPGPYLMLIFALTVFSPVIIWNFNNGFASFAFQSSRISVGGIKLRYFYQFLFGQIGYLLPVFFIACAGYAYKLFKRIFKYPDNRDLFVLCFGIAPVMLFFAAALYRRVLPHWPVIGYTVLAIPVGGYFHRIYRDRPKKFFFSAALHVSIVITAVVLSLVQVNYGVLFNRQVPLDGKAGRQKVRDISVDIIGWKETAGFISSEYEPDECFLFSHKWYLSGQIAFSVKGRYDTFCLSKLKDSRGFSYWQKQEKYAGKKGIFICTSKYYKDPKLLYPDHFDDIFLKKKIDVYRRSKVVKVVYIYECGNFTGKYEIEQKKRM